jgi:predicted nuclease of restriction endonuclease-like (RecB) superfamily
MLRGGLDPDDVVGERARAGWLCRAVGRAEGADARDAVRAARAANIEVLRLYWSVGRDILDRQRAAGWGSTVVASLAADLQREFLDQRGWSRSNLLYMRRAAETWPTEEEFVHHVGGRLPWRHVTVLLDRLETREERDWYAARAMEDGWSRAVLEHQVKANLRSAVG